MPCYHPVQGFRSQKKSSTGKFSLTFNPKDGYRDLPVTIPCGQCIGCCLERSRQWAIRCMHESSLYEKNCFITLTYNNKFLPKDLSLHKEHIQKFIKRLRKHIYDDSQKEKEKQIYNNHSSPRYFHCGEYGEVCKNCGQSKHYCTCNNYEKTIGRPHYHACIFNFDFMDKIFLKTVNDNKYYISETLNSLWTDPETHENLGFSTIGDVTFESAAYVARYITKKITNHKTNNKYKNHYQSTNHQSGEIYEVLPEYTTMSRRPGIGKGWLDKYFTDVYPSDEVILRGKQIKPPKYYDKLFEKIHPENYELVKTERRINNKQNAENNTEERLLVREELKLSQLKQLKRSFENET